MGNVHRALPLTGTICMATAARITGSVVNRVLRAGTGDIRIIQPSGVIVCAADVVERDGAWHAEKAVVVRTQRRLFDGFVYVPASALAGVAAA